MSSGSSGWRGGTQPAVITDFRIACGNPGESSGSLGSLGTLYDAASTDGTSGYDLGFGVWRPPRAPGFDYDTMRWSPHGADFDSASNSSRKWRRNNHTGLLAVRVEHLLEGAPVPKGVPPSGVVSPWLECAVEPADPLRTILLEDLMPKHVIGAVERIGPLWRRKPRSKLLDPSTHQGGADGGDRWFRPDGSRVSGSATMPKRTSFFACSTVRLRSHPPNEVAPRRRLLPA